MNSIIEITGILVLGADNYYMDSHLRMIYIGVICLKTSLRERFLSDLSVNTVSCNIKS